MAHVCNNSVLYSVCVCVTDMTVERNLLMREAVPYLRDYCKERMLDYQVSVTYLRCIIFHINTLFTDLNLCILILFKHNSSTTLLLRYVKHGFM